MKPRPALLFQRYTKEGDPLPVTWHYWGIEANYDGPNICAVVEHWDGKVDVIQANLLQFTDRKEGMK